MSTPSEEQKEESRKHENESYEDLNGLIHPEVRTEPGGRSRS